MDARTLFHELADLSLAEREQYYSQRDVPRSVRAEVESLLSFDVTGDGSLGGRVASAAQQFFGSDPPGSAEGECGPYRLVRLLGNGGMGSVHLAERVDGELKQRVAIKFLRPGADSPSFRERFFRERQILASLNHPGIARLLDAGRTGDHPYLVMEYVDGKHIDEYSAGMDPRDVIRLVLCVAEAVAYAHRNLIIHRDIKPSNILIDSTGQPKLLDFGIAKMMDEPGETRTHDRLLTPDYCSPEQIEGGLQTTATDIYSLGAVLYNLLTGQTPAVAGVPSGRTLPKDLAAIVGKAIRKEPEERYATVDALIEDLRAYLEHRPVRALRGNAWYLTRMFVRRNRLAVGVSALALVGLAAGLLVAERARIIAERRFQQVRQLSNRFFEIDSEIRGLPGATKARQRLVSASVDYLERLRADAKPSPWRRLREQDSDLALEIGIAYLKVARVQGVPGNTNLGQFSEARQNLAKADYFAESVLTNNRFPRRRRALLLSAEAAHDSMILAETENRDAAAMQLAGKAAGRLESLMKSGNTKEEAAVVASLYVSLALSCSNLHRLDEATGYARRSVEISSRYGSSPAQLSRSLGALANTARFSGHLEEALDAIRVSRSVAETASDPNDAVSTLVLAGALWREGLILGELNNINLNRVEEAVPLLRRSFDLSEGLARRDPHDYASRSYVSMTGRELGDVLRDNAPAQALAVYDHARARLAEVKGNRKSSRDQIWLLTGSSYALRRLHRADEAIRRIDAAFVILREFGEYPAAEVALGDLADAALRARADHYADTGDIAAAIATYQELLAKALASNPQPLSDLRHANALSRIYRDLGSLYRRANRVAEAMALDQKRLELWRFWDNKLPNNVFVTRQLADLK